MVNLGSWQRKNLVVQINQRRASSLQGWWLSGMYEHDGITRMQWFATGCCWKMYVAWHFFFGFLTQSAHTASQHLVFNNPSLRGLTLTKGDWETLQQVADFLEVCHNNKEPIAQLLTIKTRFLLMPQPRCPKHHSRPFPGSSLCTWKWSIIFRLRSTIAWVSISGYGKVPRWHLWSSSSTRSLWIPIGFTCWALVRTFLTHKS